MNKFTNLFEAAYNLRKFIIERDGLEAYRLYDRENDKLTEVSVDVYREWAEIQVYAQMPDKKIFQVVESLSKDFGVKGVYIKDRTKEGSKNFKSGFLYGERHPKDFIFEELGFKYIVELEDYLDTGVFLDARDIRKLVKKYSKGKRVLNLFSYTAMSSLAAISGSADETVSVDISKTYTDWARKNLALNEYNLTNNRLITEDVINFLNSEKGRDEKYDLILVDPPTFSHSKKGDFSIQRDHVRLLNDCLYCLADSGFIIFTNHYQQFHFAKEKIKAKIIEITNSTIPIDFKQDIHHSFKIVPSQKWEKIEERKVYASKRREWKKESHRSKRKRNYQ